MKKLLLLCSMAVSALMSAQSFSIYSETNAADVSNMTVTYFLSEADTGIIGGVVTEMEVHNNSASAKQMQYKRRQVMVGNSTSYFCNCSNCYSDTTSTPVFCPTVQPAALCSLSSHFTWDATVGTAIIRYTIYDKNNPSDSVFVNLVFYCTLGPFGVNGLAASPVKFGTVLPNPAASAMLFDYSAKDVADLNFVLSDICGRSTMIIRPENAEGRERIDISQLPAGVYFLTMNGAGIESRTQRVVVAH